MSAPGGLLFEFEAVSGGYGGGIVVDDVSGAVVPGQALCVLGRNGVGKSTLVRLLYGLLALRGGQVRFRGEPVAGLAPDAMSRRGIGYGPQERVVFDGLSVRDNLTLMRPDRTVDHLASYFERFPRLAERLTQRAGTLSGGERKLLAFVRLLAEDKPLTLIDEPSEGVQRENVEHMAALVNARKAAGGAFLIVEQNLDLVSAIATHWLVLDHGRTVLEGEGAFDREAVLRHLEV